MLEIILYSLLAIYVLHLIAAAIFYIVVSYREDKKIKELKIFEAEQKIQYEWDQVEMRRQQREQEYYDRMATVQAAHKVLAETIVMQICPPPPPRKKL